MPSANANCDATFYAARSGSPSGRGHRPSLGHVRDGHASGGGRGSNDTIASAAANSSNPAASWLRVYCDHDGLMGRFADAPENESEARAQTSVHPSVLALLVREATRNQRGSGGAARPEERGGNGDDNVEDPWWQQDEEDDEECNSSEEEEGGGKFADADGDGTVRGWEEYVGAEALTQLSSISGTDASDRNLAMNQVGAEEGEDRATMAVVDNAPTGHSGDNPPDRNSTGKANMVEAIGISIVSGGLPGGHSCADSDMLSLGMYQRRAAVRLRTEEEEQGCRHRKTR